MKITPSKTQPIKSGEVAMEFEWLNDSRPPQTNVMKSRRPDCQIPASLETDICWHLTTSHWLKVLRHITEGCGRARHRALQSEVCFVTRNGLREVALLTLLIG